MATNKITTDALADDAVTNAKIADDSVGLEHLDFDAGDADRFISIDASGNPSLTTDVGSGDFDPADYKLNEFAAPDGTLSIGNQILRNVSDPTNDVDAATKGWCESNFIGSTAAPLSHYESVGTLVNSITTASVTVAFFTRLITVSWEAPSATYKSSMSCILDAAVNTWVGFDISHVAGHSTGHRISIRNVTGGLEIKYDGNTSITNVYVFCLPDPAEI